MNEPQGSSELPLLMADLGQAVLALGGAQVAVVNCLRDRVSCFQKQVDQLTRLQACIDQLEAVVRDGVLRMQDLRDRIAADCHEASSEVRSRLG